MTKKITVWIGCIIFFLLAFPMKVQAENSLSAEYNNQLTNYVPDTYGACRTSFISSLSNGGYQTVIYNDGIIYVNNYDSSYRLTWYKQVELELPLWGGVFLGNEYNYVVCGNGYNTGLENGGETYRVIQYDKEFNRIKSISFNGEQTYTAVPFAGGNVSIDENGKVLMVYTSRQRLDGHQSNIALRINTEDMTVYDSNGTGKFPDVHTSHSFRQIIKYDNGTPVYVDLSDGDPERSVYFQNENWHKSLMDISGQKGNNVTNAEVSGLEISETHCLVVGSYIYQEINNIFISCIDKSSGAVSQQWLTDSSRFQPKYVANPRIVKISGNKYIVMWQTVNAINYVIVSENGKVISGVKESTDVEITDCEPIFDKGKVIWLSVKEGINSFNEITDFTETGTLELTDNTVVATNSWNGTTDISWYSESGIKFRLTTPEQLGGLAELVNDGNTFLGKTVELGDDIFLNNESYRYAWIPMEGWEGTFNGNGHTIYNMYVPYDSYGGLFGTIEENGIVKAVNISQGILNSGGCIAHLNKGIIAFCNNYSSIGSADDFDAGGICNENWNLVHGCKNYGRVKGYTVGGIVGNNLKSIAVVSQCSNFGLVEAMDNGAGIVGYNYGWIYNCYNSGLVSNASLGNINRGDSLSGIVYRNDSCDVESCYSAGAYLHSQDLRRGPNAIVYENTQLNENIINCYTLPMDGLRGMATIVTEDSMKTTDFVEKLNYQTNTVLPAWVADTDMINDGFPITVADYNASKGIYKFQPELWMTSERDFIYNLNDDSTRGFSVKCYYNEEPLVVTIEDESIAEVSYSNDWIYITPLSSGTTKINLHFNETENNIAVDYKLNITVESAIDISGTIKCYGDNDTETLLQLWHSSGFGIEEISLSGNLVNYNMDKISEGKYTLEASRKNHVTREYQFEITSKSENILQNIELHLIGDITGDGVINARDKKTLFNHIAGTSKLTDYAFEVADVNDDGVINARDKKMVFNHIAGTNSLWK